MEGLTHRCPSVVKRGNRTGTQSAGKLTSRGSCRVSGTLGYSSKHRTKVPMERLHKEGLWGLWKRKADRYQQGSVSSGKASAFLRPKCISLCGS